MRALLKRSFLTDAAVNTVHLLFPGATGHIPSIVLRTLQHVGHVIYLEGAYPKAESELKKTFEDILEQLGTLADEARITEIHSYCAGIFPATGLIHRLKDIEKLSELTHIYCYDPPCYPMHVATATELFSKMLDSFKLGLSALFIENGLSLPDFTDLTADGIENMEMLIGEIETWIGLVFSSSDRARSLGLAYCHNLLMQNSTHTIQREMIALSTDPSMALTSYFSDTTWQEDDVAALQSEAIRIRIEKCPARTHGQLMALTAQELREPQVQTDRIAPVVGEVGLSMGCGHAPKKPMFFRPSIPKLSVVSTSAGALLTPGGFDKDTTSATSIQYK